ncbi:MAG: SDR family NAD(P)-dependent oxidoreductase, partial [Tardiphaga sp.]|nr:SDR family NAD(P)-dependent oxidoreductase [Tardiphaga sp.]
MSELDFGGKTVLVIGGSSGIGNGIARAFHRKGANVHVYGTRASAADYNSQEGSDLTDLHYARLDVSNSAEIEALEPAFETLDI